ncbi:MAG: F0F1 ATP synthase subunit delta [Cycloclasticus sp.]|nr:F0F1 ATP synthase subunit delta [Cycloclasticus sp.]|tara:strand:+ start:78890 stop:79423 length:534 start_codon:yes stop_codon:yes gene_type:complete
MAELAALARPYAEAVFLMANEKDQLDHWSEMLDFLQQVTSDELLKKVSDNPKVSKKQLQGAMMDICQDHMDADGLNLIKLLIQNNRLQLAGEIFKQYETKKDQKCGSLDVSIISAFPMSDEEQVALTTSLSASFSKQVKISVEEDSSLIGGMIIRAGDKVIDGSLSGQIQQLAKQLK